jgi:hypothetical protein
LDTRFYLSSLVVESLLRLNISHLVRGFDPWKGCSHLAKSFKSFRGLENIVILTTTFLEGSLLDAGFLLGSGSDFVHLGRRPPCHLWRRVRSLFLLGTTTFIPDGSFFLLMRNCRSFEGGFFFLLGTTFLGGSFFLLGTSFLPSWSFSLLVRALPLLGSGFSLLDHCADSTLVVISARIRMRGVDLVPGKTGQCELDGIRTADSTYLCYRFPVVLASRARVSTA